MTRIQYKDYDTETLIGRQLAEAPPPVGSGVTFQREDGAIQKYRVREVIYPLVWIGDNDFAAQDVVVWLGR